MNERIGNGAVPGCGGRMLGSAVAACLLAALLAMGLALAGPVGRAEAKQAVAAEPALSAQAATEVTGNGVEYQVNSGIVTITGYSGGASALDLSALNIGVITAIGNNAFDGQSQLASIVFPETLQSIGTRSFQGCTSLRSLDLPEGVTSLGGAAFRNCTSLSSVVVRSRELGVSDWLNGYYAWPFENAGTGAGGISATFASTCKAVPANFFNHHEGAPKVASIAVASGVAQIGNAAFQGCSYLATVSLPNSVTAIGEYAFNNCTDLAALRIPPNVPADALGSRAYIDLALNSAVTATTGEQYERLKENSDYINTMRTTVILASNSLYRAKVSSIANKAYTGKKVAPSLTVKMGSKTLKQGTDYTLSYSDNKFCGKATVTVKGKGAYVGTKAVSFNVVPAKVTGVKASSPYRGRVNIEWSTKKAQKAGASGYRIYWKVAGKKKGSYGFVSYPSGSSSYVYDLPAKKKVTVKVQAYVTVDGKNAYGPWSTSKTVTVKN